MTQEFCACVDRYRVRVTDPAGHLLPVAILRLTDPVAREDRSTGSIAYDFSLARYR
jgi:hypothetical protein